MKEAAIVAVRLPIGRLGRGPLYFTRAKESGRKSSSNPVDLCLAFVQLLIYFRSDHGPEQSFDVPTLRQKTAKHRSGNLGNVLGPQHRRVCDRLWSGDQSGTGRHAHGGFGAEL